MALFLVPVCRVAEHVDVPARLRRLPVHVPTEPAEVFLRIKNLCFGRGCQIFLDAMYQNGGKYTKQPKNYPMFIKNAKLP
jgi:hypothetical protein